ncbi:MAG: hypothetical protein Q9227_009185 [Pyrenula ochraceoflavens]
MFRRPIIFIITVLGSFMYMMNSPASLLPEGNNDDAAWKHFEYSTVTGYLLQDEPSTDPANFDYTATNFGLINQTYDTDTGIDAKNLYLAEQTQWQRFSRRLSSLNAATPPDVQYKLIFMGRHGQGYHNVAQDYYGTKAWDCYWSRLDGNGSVTWSDAHLTPTGIAQAAAVHDFWARQITDQKISTPQRYYVSPLYRCLQTAETTFSGLPLPTDRPFEPVIKELLREAIGLHTCDRRSPLSTLLPSFPSPPFQYPSSLTENDTLWSPTHRESDLARDTRMLRLLDDIFAHDRSEILSFTSHSGAIASLLRVLGHREFPLQTSAVIPVLVRAQEIRGKRKEEKHEWVPGEACDDHGGGEDVAGKKRLIQ